MIFGVLRSPKARLPGSIRSGEYTSEKSSPATRPVVSSNGRKTSSVVPG